MIALMNRDHPTATVTAPSLQAPSHRLPRARLVLASADLDVQDAVQGLFGDAIQGGLAIAASSTEAMAALDDQRTDLLLLDLDLGHDEVLACLTRLRNDGRWQFLPVIVLSGTRDGSIRLAALERGATEILAKPLDPVELELRLRNMLALKAYRIGCATWIRSPASPIATSSCTGSTPCSAAVPRRPARWSASTWSAFAR